VVVGGGVRCGGGAQILRHELMVKAKLTSPGPRPMAKRLVRAPSQDADFHPGHFAFPFFQVGGECAWQTSCQALFVAVPTGRLAGRVTVLQVLNQTHGGGGGGWVVLDVGLLLMMIIRHSGCRRAHVGGKDRWRGRIATRGLEHRFLCHRGGGACGTVGRSRTRSDGSHLGVFKVRFAHAIKVSLRLLVAAWNAALFGDSAMSLANSLAFDDAAASRRFAVATLVLDHALRALLLLRRSDVASTGGGCHVGAVDGSYYWLAGAVSLAVLRRGVTSSITLEVLL